MYVDLFLEQYKFKPVCLTLVIMLQWCIWQFGLGCFVEMHVP